MTFYFFKDSTSSKIPNFVAVNRNALKVSDLAAWSKTYFKLTLKCLANGLQMACIR